MQSPTLDQIKGLIFDEEEPQLELLFVLARRLGPAALRHLLDLTPRLVESRGEPLVFAALANHLVDRAADSDQSIRRMADQVVPKILQVAERNSERELASSVLGDLAPPDELASAAALPAPAGPTMRAELLDSVQRYPHADRLQALCASLSDGEQVELTDLVTNYFVEQNVAAAPRPEARPAGRSTGILLTGSGRPKPGLRGQGHRARPETGGESAGAGGEETPAPSRSLVRTGLAEAENAARSLGPGQPLRRARAYFFWMELGSAELHEPTLDREPEPIPVSNLPPDARLTVSVFAGPGGLEVDGSAASARLRYRPDGSLEIEQPAARPDGVSRATLSKRLYFAIRTPAAPGVARLRCNIYHKGVLLQARLLRVHIDQPPPPGEPALETTLDYNFTSTFAARYLKGIDEHGMSLLMNDDDDGTHTFYFFGEDPAQPLVKQAHFAETELIERVGVLRRKLRFAAWGDENPWVDQPYNYAGTGNIQTLTRHLALLAKHGRVFYLDLARKLTASPDELAQFEARTRRPQRVQFAARFGSKEYAPVALLYDYPLNTDASSGGYRLCTSFQSALEQGRALQDTACFQGACPDVARDPRSVVCPGGFWGYRHSLGFPEAEKPGANIRPRIEYRDKPHVTVGIGGGLELGADHRRTLEQLLQSADTDFRSSRDGIIDLLKRGHDHLVYFYCHGGLAQGNRVYLRFGEHDDPFTTAALMDERIMWRDSNPLIFLNGCRTGAIGPAAFSSAADDFRYHAACGVVATEITVFEESASMFAETFLGHFLEGTQVGEGIRLARIRLLQERRDPTGLAYIPFTLSSTSLAKAKIEE
ncbi:MAG: hypothetical protein P8076_11280 [Gammaproteobacteria bacterium]